MRKVSLEEARRGLSDLVDGIHHRGEVIVVTRHNKDVMVMLPAQRYRDLTRDAKTPEWESQAKALGAKPAGYGDARFTWMRQVAEYRLRWKDNKEALSRVPLIDPSMFDLTEEATTLDAGASAPSLDDRLSQDLDGEQEGASDANEDVVTPEPAAPTAPDWRVELAALGPKPAGHGEAVFDWHASAKEFRVRWARTSEAVDAIDRESARHVASEVQKRTKEVVVEDPRWSFEARKQRFEARVAEAVLQQSIKDEFLALGVRPDGDLNDPVYVVWYRQFSDLTEKYRDNEAAQRIFRYL